MNKFSNREKTWRNLRCVLLLLIKKLISKSYTLHDSNLMTLGKKQNYRNSKKTNGCQGLGVRREGWTEDRELFTVMKLLCVTLQGWVLLLVTQLCLTLCDLMDCTPPASSVYGISQARILGEMAMSAPGDLPIQGLNPCLLHGQVDSVPLTHQGSP